MGRKEKGEAKGRGVGVCWLWVKKVGGLGAKAKNLWLLDIVFRSKKIEDNFLNFGPFCC